MIGWPLWPKGGNVILSSEFALGNHSRGGVRPLHRLSGWREGLFKFTGFREDYRRQRSIGNIVWSGVATFRSGRKERIFYQVTVSVYRANGTTIENTAGLVENLMNECAAKADQMVRAGEYGLLMNWGRRKCRLAASVDWQHIDFWTQEEDAANGVRMRGRP